MRSALRKAGSRAAVRGRVSRKAVVVQANLFARVSRLISSYANNVVSSAEDPEKLLDQVVTEMQEDLIKMRQAAAQVLASQKQLEAKYKQAQLTADDWLRRAELAVQKGEDDLAKEALRRRKSYQDSADQLKVQLEQQQKAVDQLMGNTRMLEGKLAEARSKKDTLKARAASAKTSKQIQEMVGSLNTSNAVVAFDKMEEKVMAMEAEAESTALLVGNDKLENKFALLESGTVEDELAALKSGMIKSSAPPAALPEGRPLRDALDLELEDLRRKARE
ncbi:PspA/IM30 family-domain-containing protein [Haematococcus lacustris]